MDQTRTEWHNPAAEIHFKSYSGLSQRVSNNDELRVTLDMRRGDLMKYKRLTWAWETLTKAVWNP